MTQSVRSVWEWHKSKDHNSGQTRSHASILYDSMPADCIEKVYAFQGD